MPPRGAALLLGLAAALFLFRLGSVPLIGPDEPRYARVAVEMHRSGNWVTPMLQGRPWLEKPPLYYWLAAVAYAELGETEAAARLPSVLAALLLTGATAVLGARLYGSAAGLHAGFVLATAVLPFAYGRAAAMDMLLAATMTVAVSLAALRLLGIAGRLAMPAAGVFLGLAVLAKGPIGLLLPALVVGVYLLWTRDPRDLRRVFSPAGAVLFLAAAAPWYALVYHAQRRTFLDVFLLDHNLRRFTSTIHHHAGPVAYYVPVVVLGLFPWSGLLLPALGALAPRRSRADRFVLLWFALPFCFFSAAGSKLPGYILPCLPPPALLVGRAADAIVQGEAMLPFGTGTRAAAVVNLILGSLVAASPLLLWRLGEAAWPVTVPLGLWAVLVAWSFSRRASADPAGALSLLRTGGAGLLVLLAMAAPAVVAHRESGRDLFVPSRGQEVLAWSAWRTAWMAGYFYNDGKVREVGSLAEVASEAGATGRILVLCGPAECERLRSQPTLSALTLARGPRNHALLSIAYRRAVTGRGT